MNSSEKPLIAFDPHPHPRPIDLLFDPATKNEWKASGTSSGTKAPSHQTNIFEKHLPEAVFVVGQSAMPKERLDRAAKLKAIFNVESNFLPNVDYGECHHRGIHVLSIGPVFAKPVAKMALGMALSLARRIHQGDAAIRSGS
jgi:phosphoglycerate dehydrogenase-like enzyme